MRRSIRLFAFLFVASGLPAVAAAQSSTSNVTVQQYQPTPFSDRSWRLDGSHVAPAGDFRIGLDLDYAFRPLVLVDQSAGIFQAGTSGPNHNLIEHAVGGTLLANVGLGHRLELGLVIPLALFRSGEAVEGVSTPSTAGVGGPGVGVKAGLLSWKGLGVGASALVTLPVGVGTLTHDGGIGGIGRLFADYRRGSLTVGVRGGFRLRGAQTFHSLALANEIDFAAGAQLQLAARTSILAEVAGAAAAKHPFADNRETPVEALAGLRQRVGRLWFTVGAGPGLVHGYGSPAFRAVAGLSWANRAPDSDGDGVSDDDDQCPDEPEDRDGFEDTDGCPELDNDKDGIPDAQDKCPTQAEDKDGFEDTDGCPDLDNDKDGVPDAQDKCPDKSETKNGFEDEDGCPDEAPATSDKDGDGINDDDDECPEEAEDKDGFEDSDGCPDLDNDKDGILDAQDKCPLEPETINGIEDEDGCPDAGATQVRLGKGEIETLQPIFFDTDRSRVRHAFYNILGQIGLLLKAHPEIGRCAIEGHTDETGPPEWNQKLSVLRAESVIEFLVGKGVDRKRLVAIGHGEKSPWTSNETEWGRSRNRRVVFHIEGVDPEIQKKQIERQERRQRIRRRHEKSHPEAPGAAEGTRKEEPKVPAETPKPPGAKPAGAKASDHKEPDAQGAATKSAEKVPAKSSASTEMPQEKATDAKERTNAARPSDRRPVPPAATTPKAEEPEAEPAPEAPKGGNAKKHRPPARPPEEHPETLKDLLKLPQRTP